MGAGRGQGGPERIHVSWAAPLHRRPILDDASGSHRKLDPAEGLQDAQLDTGAHIHIVHGDVGRDGHVLVNITKFTGVAFRTLDELVESDMLDDKVAAFLRACVRARLSIVVAGAPGSGRTTLLWCCARPSWTRRCGW